MYFYIYLYIRQYSSYVVLIAFLKKLTATKLELMLLKLAYLERMEKYLEHEEKSEYCEHRYREDAPEMRISNITH